jgi:hypothetical protein
MQTLQAMTGARAERTRGRDIDATLEPARDRHFVPFGAGLLAIVIAGQIIGLATNMLAGELLTALLATTFTLQRMRREVAEIRHEPEI